MGKYSSKQDIKNAIGHLYPDILEMLDHSSINFQMSSRLFAQIAKESPKHAKLLLSYRKLIEKENSNSVFPYPEDPFYTEFYNETEESVENFTKEIKTQWEKHKYSHFKKSKNVIYDDRDYFTEVLNACKYPVIGENSLCEFLERTKRRIQKSNGKDKPEIEDLTFVQPMFCEDKNGNIIRMLRVVEIRPYNKLINKEEVQTFNFSISYKILPDNDLNHATCVLRVDSDKSVHEDLHFHFFDRLSTFVYLGKPLSSCPYTLNEIIGMSKHDDAKNKQKFYIQNLVNQKSGLLNLRETLSLAEKRLKGEKAYDKKQSWLTQLYAVKMTLNLLDKAFETEKEQSIEELQKLFLGMETKFEAEQIVSEPKHRYPKKINNKPINEVRGKGHGNEIQRKEILRQKRQQVALEKQRVIA